MNTAAGLMPAIKASLQRRWDDADQPEPTLEDEAYVAAATALVYLRAVWDVDALRNERDDLAAALDEVVKEVFARFEFDSWSLPAVRRALGVERVRELRRVLHEAAATQDAEGWYGMSPDGAA